MTAYQDIPLGQIQPSPTNPRTHFDPDKLAELAESVRAKGVLQPVLVRPFSAARRPALADMLRDAVPGLAEKTYKALLGYGITQVVELRARAEGLGKAGAEADGESSLVYRAARTVPNVSAADAQALADALCPEEEGGYELVAGERRYRAAKLAGLAAIPATVRTLTDVEVLEVQAVENDQREDVLPSERAAGYQRLVDAMVATGVAREAACLEVSRRVGKSLSWLRSVLKLGRLSEDALDAVDSGRLPRATAELIARVPGEAARKRVELCVIQGAHVPDQVNNRGKPAAEPLSYRDTKVLIGRYFQVELKAAPFGQKDAALVPAAGACTDCPKRAGNAGEEFAEVRADMCLDPGCYQEKLKALRAREEEEAKAGGRKILDKKEAAKVFCKYGGLSHDAPYLDLTDTCYDDKKQRTYAQILRTAPTHTEVVIGYHPESGKRYELALKTAVRAALAAAGIKSSVHVPGGRSAGPKSEAEKKEDARLRHEAKVKRLTVAGILAEVAGEAEHTFGNLVQPGFGQPGHTSTKLLLAVVTDKLDRTSSGTAEDVCTRRLLPVGGATANRHALAELAGGMTAVELFGLLVELVGHSEATGWGKGDLLKLLDVDKKAVEQDVTARLKAEAAAKAKPSANGHAGTGKPKKAKEPAGV